MPSDVPTSLRETVYRRAGGCCEYCLSQARFSTQPFSVEHVFPRSRGGKATARNLALACQGCNNHKYNKTRGTDSITGQESRLFNPRRDRWHEHFTWSEDCTTIIGLSPVGRATVEGLRLNRPGLLELRRVLFAVGEHPPTISTFRKPK